MRRLFALAAALAIAAGPLAAGGQAWAKDHDGPRGGGRGEQHGGGRWGGGERGGPPGGGGWRGEGGGNGRWGGGERGGPPGRWEGGGEARGDPRADPRYERGYPERGYERGYPSPQAYGTPRRGGYLGPQGGAPIEDPGRYRLREAPRGYMWVRVPGGMAMVSQATGQVFDVVPDGR